MNLLVLKQGRNNFKLCRTIEKKHKNIMHRIYKFQHLKQNVYSKIGFLKILIHKHVALQNSLSMN